MATTVRVVCQLPNKEELARFSEQRPYLDRMVAHLDRVEGHPDEGAPPLPQASRSGGPGLSAREFFWPGGGRPAVYIERGLRAAGGGPEDAVADLYDLIVRGQGHLQVFGEHGKTTALLHAFWRLVRDYADGSGPRYLPYWLAPGIKLPPPRRLQGTPPLAVLLDLDSYSSEWSASSLAQVIEALALLSSAGHRIIVAHGNARAATPELAEFLSRLGGAIYEVEPLDGSVARRTWQQRGFAAAQIDAWAKPLERRPAPPPWTAYQRTLAAVAALLIVVGLSLLAFGLVGDAVRANSVALATAQAANQRQARLAQAQQLSADAITQAARDPQLGLLLAREAVSLTVAWGEPVAPAAESALHQTLLGTRILYTLRGHGGPVRAVAFSPDSRVCASVADDGSARLWDARSGAALLTMQAGAPLSAVAFSPTGRLLTVGDRRVTIWEAQSSTPLLEIPQPVAAQSAAFSPDGALIVSAGADGQARIWRADTGGLLGVLGGANQHHGAMLSAQFSPDGSRVVTAGADKLIKVWDRASGALLNTLSGHLLQVNSARFSPDGRLIGSAGDDGSYLWDATTGERLAVALRGQAGAISDIEFARDGASILTSSRDGTARLWNSADGRVLFTLAAALGGYNGATFSPDGKLICSAHDSGAVAIWGVNGGVERASLTGASGYLFSAAYSPDGRSVVTGGADRLVRVWDAASGALVRTLAGHQGAVTSVAYSPDGRLIASASFDKTAMLWDSASGTPQRTLRGHSDVVSSVAFSPDGRLLATAGWDGNMILWNAATGAQLRRLVGQTDRVRSVAFSPDGTLVAAAGQAGFVTVWAVEGGELRQRLEEGGWLWRVAFSPDNRLLATAGEDHTIRVWDLQNAGAQPQVLLGHSDGVHGLAFSPGGDLLLSAGIDGTARLWDLGSGQQRVALQWDPAWIWDLAVSRDGRYLVTAGADGSARQYLLRIPDLLTLAETRLTRGLTPDERSFYLGNRVPGSLSTVP